MHVGSANNYKYMSIAFHVDMHSYCIRLALILGEQYFKIAQMSFTKETVSPKWVTQKLTIQYLEVQPTHWQQSYKLPHPINNISCNF